MLQRRGFAWLRIISRGAGIYPTMCDFEKRDIDRYRIAIDAPGPLANQGFNYAWVPTAFIAVQADIVGLGGYCSCYGA